MDYHVEELADSSGVAVDTIRYYQREKLLAPPRREGRRAFYDDAHLERIQEIRSLAQQGFSLAQIRELSAGDGSGLLVDLAQQNAVDPDLDKAELARRAEIPEFLIDVVVSAGLLTPIGEGDDRGRAERARGWPGCGAQRRRAERRRACRLRAARAHRARAAVGA